MANGPPEEGAYQCFFNRDDLPSPTSKQPGRRVSVTLPPAFAPYFPPKATTKQIEETIQKALALYFKTMGNAS